MAPHDIPHHWKQIEEKLENVFFVQENEDTSDSEDPSDYDDTISSLDASDVEDIIAFVVHEDFPESDVDSIVFYPLSEDEDEDGDTTPIRHDVPDVRRRLFDSSSGEEDDDGVAYLDD